MHSVTVHTLVYYPFTGFYRVFVVSDSTFLNFVLKFYANNLVNIKKFWKNYFEEQKKTEYFVKYSRNNKYLKAN